MLFDCGRHPKQNNKFVRITRLQYGAQKRRKEFFFQGIMILRNQREHLKGQAVKLSRLAMAMELSKAS